MTIVASHIEEAQTTTSDCVPDLFDALSRRAREWLLDVFPVYGSFIPLVVARQEMAGDVNPLRPPGLFNSEFRILRVGEATFDLQGQLVDVSGRTVARAVTVFAVANRETASQTPIPPWLARTLNAKVPPEGSSSRGAEFYLSQATPAGLELAEMNN